MTNKPKIKGTRWETACADFLRPWWPKIKRLSLEGAADPGDLSHPETWAVECKDKPYAGNLPAILREAEVEAANKGAPWFIALIKNRRSKGETGQVQDGYAVTRTRVWADVAYRLDLAENTLKHIAALGNRLTSDLPDRRLTQEAFVTLTREALVHYADGLDAPGYRALELDDE